MRADRVRNFAWRGSSLRDFLKGYALVQGKEGDPGGDEAAVPCDSFKVERITPPLSENLFCKGTSGDDLGSSRRVHGWGLILVLSICYLLTFLCRSHDEIGPIR